LTFSTLFPHVRSGGVRDLIIRHLKSAVGKSAGGLLRVVPPRRRFWVALRFANAIGSVRETISALRGRPFRLGSGREYTLAYLLGCMDLQRLEFATAIRVIGLDQLRLATARKRGVLVVTTHANAGLARLILRPLFDSELPAVTVSTGSGFPICGTGLLGETIAPNSAFLLRVRSKLRAGFVVCAMIDAPNAENLTPHHVSVDGGSTWLADPIIRMAVRWQVPVASLKGSLGNSGVVLELEISSSQNEDEVIRALSSFISPCMAE
jgi:hypothetical protein